MGRCEEELMTVTNDTLNRVALWMDGASLRLALQKTEAVLLVGNRRTKGVKFVVAGAEMKPRKAIRYLEVLLDRQMSFSSHVQFAAKKAEGVVAALGRMMPNLKGHQATPGSHFDPAIRGGVMGTTTEVQKRKTGTR
jgi:hypothetical protein